MKRKRKEAQEKDNIEKRVQEEAERQRAQEESEHNGAKSTGYM